MIERIRILTKLQLSNQSKLFLQNSKRKYVFAATRIALFILITAIAGVIMYFLKNYLYIPINNYFMISIILLTQVMSIVSAVMSLVVDIYQSKDNQILLTLPAKNDEIFISKIVVYSIHEFARNFYFLFPFLVGFGVVSQLSLIYYILLMLLTVLLPLISVTFASLVSILVTVISSYLKRHNILSFILNILLILLFFLLIVHIVRLIPTPIRLVQLYNRFIISLTQFMQRVASYGLIYTIIGKMLYGEKVIGYLFITLGTSALLVLLNYFICRPLFFSLSSNANETMVQNKNHKKIKSSNTLFKTFFHKETTIAKRSLNEMLSDYSLLLSLPFFMYTLNYIYMGMNRSTIGNQFVLVFNIFIVLIIVTGSNTQSASAITKEGYEFVLLKTAPSNTSQVAWAKMAFNFIFTTIMIAISFILFAIALPAFNKLHILLLFFVIIIINASHILWSFQIDIISPRLSEYAQTGSLSNNKNIEKSLSNGLVMSLIISIISAILFILFEDYAWPVLFGLSILWLGFRFIQFKNYLKAYFIEIEY